MPQIKRIKRNMKKIASSGSAAPGPLVEKLRKKLNSQREAIKQIREQLEIFFDISTLLTLGPALNDVVREIYKKIEKRTRVTSVLIWLLDEKKEFFYLAAHYLIPEGLLKVFMETRLRSDQGTPGIVFRTKKFYLMKDLYSDPRAIPKYLEAVRESGAPMRSILSFPMILEGEVVGVFSFFFPEPKELIARTEFIIFSTIANQMASFIQNSKIYRELQQRIEQLEKINKLTVGRELIMRELKNEIKKLEEELEKCQKTNPQN